VPRVPEGVIVTSITPDWPGLSESGENEAAGLAEICHRGGVGNIRNGSTSKTLSTEHGPVQVNTPRDRDGSFEPKIVRKRQWRFEAWRDSWDYVIPFLSFEPDVRRVIYRTNAIEAVNRQLRKAVKTKGHFPTEDAVRKLLYLAIQNAVPQWTRARSWTKTLLAFKIQFGDRLPDWSAPPIRLWPPCEDQSRGYRTPDRVGGPAIPTRSAGRHAP
jgi:transposase-like protein